MRNHRLALLVALSCTLVFPFQAARAGSILVVGADGTIGAGGVDGNPGAPGSDGTDGGAATAIADDIGSVSEAIARGGAGGDGGMGGHGVLPSSAGGDGGQGGEGGDAEAVADGGSSNSATANAEGGRGGVGGDGGYSGDSLTRGTTGAGGDGGSAVASASTALTMGSANASATATATGGDGGTGGGRPGDASAHADAASSPQFTSNVSIRATATALAGNGSSGVGSSIPASDGATATGSAHAETVGLGHAFAVVDVTGGNGGANSDGVGASGGTAAGSASVEAPGFGYGAVSGTASVHATGGDGGYGTSGGDGADVSLVDTVSGTSDDRLSFEQTAVGGSGGEGVSGSGGSGGDAYSSLTRVGDSEEIFARVDATGGAGGAGGYAATAAGEAGDATAIASGVNTGLMSVEAVAEGGAGQLFGYGSSADVANGGDATASAMAHSTSSDAFATATAHGGDSGAVIGASGSLAQTGVATANAFASTELAGTTAHAVAEVYAGFGARSTDLTLINVAGGATPGTLILEQRAFAGDAVLGPRGADATSELTSSVSNEALEIEVYSRSGGVYPFDSAASAPGGTATSRAIGRNDAGSVEIVAGAEGSGNAGRAIVYAEGTTSGDGHAVSIGSPSYIGIARGSSLVMEGGAATSQSVGVALGNSSVTVLDQATGGQGSGAGVRPGDGRAGGAASSTATGTNAGSENVTVTATAQGGYGGGGTGLGRRSGDGGAVTASASGASTGGGNVTVTAREQGGHAGSLRSGATAGIGADSHMHDAVSGSTAGTLTLIQEASGGSSLGTRAGAATSELVATNPGGGALNILATAIGGIGGGSFGPQGNAVATAAGSSTTGADVSVTATQRQGSATVPNTGRIEGLDSTMVDAVTGSTAGKLTLRQVSTAGNGGRPVSAGPAPSSGGDAVSVLNATNPGHGDLEAWSEAVGGSGLNNNVDAQGGGVGGTALASNFAQETGHTSVTVGAISRGGYGGGAFSGGNGVDGRGASLGSVYGGSLGGGDVRVIGELYGGAGGLSQVAGSRAGNGSAVSVENALDGSTSGRLAFEQTAVGGDGGSSEDGTSGRGGDATSRFTRLESVELLEVTVGARGGVGGFLRGTGSYAGDGGDAVASASATNAAGDVAATARVFGGDGGYGVQDTTDAPIGRPYGGDGGRASASATASTLGDGHGVVIGSAIAGESGVTGGRGGHSTTANVAAQAGDGGDATSESTGIASGVSRVEVWDRATGGAGGSVNSWSFSPPPNPSIYQVGDGGDANSSAFGSSHGGAPILVSAQATGGAAGGQRTDFGAGRGGDAAAVATGASDGDGGVQVSATATGGSDNWLVGQPFYQALGGVGGAASADASGSGLGHVDVSANAAGGRTRGSTHGGDAFARATGVGSEGDLVADASTGATAITSVTSHANAPLLDSASVAAFASEDGSVLRGSLADGHAVFAFTSTLLDSAETAAAVAAHPTVSSALASFHTSSTTALVDVGAARTQTGSDSILLEASASFEFGQLDSSDDAMLMISFVDPAVLGGGFDRLQFEATLGTTEIYDEEFTSVAAALAFFDDRVNVLDGILTEDLVGQILSLSFGWEISGTGDGFATSVLINMVPEPSAGLLVAIGLLAIAARQRSSRARSRLRLMRSLLMGSVVARDMAIRGRG